MKKSPEKSLSGSRVKWIWLLGAIMAAQLAAVIPGTESTLLLFDFRNPQQTRNWRVVTDRIKGGNSTAGIVIAEGSKLKFSGSLGDFLHSNFCLAYSPPVIFQLRSYGGLLIRLRGDGKYYRVRLYNHTDIESVFYQAGFNTHPNRLMTVFLPFSAFIPYLNHRLVRDWPVLDQSNIKRIAIAISHQAPENFRLEIFWIRARER